MTAALLDPEHGLSHTEAEGESPPGPAVRLRLRLIGQMTATVAADGRSVLPLGRKTRALLAILAIAATRPMLRSKVAELLWSRRLEEQARASLRQEIHRLLDALQPAGPGIVIATRDQLTLRSELVALDVDEGLHATPEDPSALALLDGELLEGFDGLDPALDAWLATERQRLRDRARKVAETVLAGQKGPDAILGTAALLLRMDPAHEGAWRAVMRAHADRGERSLAIQAYERCCSALASYMGAQPSDETRGLITAIRVGVQLTSPPVEGGRHAARLGVLPLLSIGGSEETPIAAGLAEGLTAALARFRWINSVSPAALARAGTRDEAALRRGFGLDFLLDGSVQRTARTVRVTLRLLDVRDGNQVVWARHFDRDDEDPLRVQDDVAAEVAAQLDPAMLRVEGLRAAAMPTADATAYDLVVRALPLMMRLGRDDFTAAGALLAKAQTLEPDYAAAQAWRAYWACLCIAQGWAERRDDIRSLAGNCAERAITVDSLDARYLTIAGHVRVFVFHRHREALELHARALALNPNLPMAWGLSAVSYTYLGELEEAGRRFARYRRLAPEDPQAFIFDAAATRLELARRNYEGAVEIGRRATEINPFWAVGLQNYLSALGHSGLRTEADAVRRRLLTVNPGFTVAEAARLDPSATAAEQRHFLDGLRRAGVIEGTSTP